MAKIAVEFEPMATPRGSAPAAGRPNRRVLAWGDGWSVTDVICIARAHTTDPPEILCVFIHDTRAEGVLKA